MISYLNSFVRYLMTLSVHIAKATVQSLLLKCVDNWKTALDRNQFVSLLSMDLSKAFDCLPHGLIISKLHAYGVSTPACELLFSYLHGRKQRVKISTSRSSWTILSKGIPQGSILGPLLFNTFMNDLFLFIEKCKLYNYADDNSLDSSSDDLLEALRNLKRDGRNAICWFTKNGMQANPDKFHFMLLSLSLTSGKESLRIVWWYHPYLRGCCNRPGCHYRWQPEL